jgi:NDP-sugar pyrophosphorylase family protein
MDGKKWGVSIKYIYEKEPLGTAGAIGLLPDNLPSEPIIVMNGDLLTKVNFNSLIEFHDEHNAEATICVREYDFQVPYGVVKAHNHSVTSIIEKPLHKFFVNAGIYVLDLQLIKKINGIGYLDMPQMLENLINEDKVVNMFPVHEYWLDIGQIDQYNEAKKDW